MILLYPATWCYGICSGVCMQAICPDFHQISCLYLYQWWMVDSISLILDRVSALFCVLKMVFGVYIIFCMKYLNDTSWMYLLNLLCNPRIVLLLFRNSLESMNANSKCEPEDCGTVPFLILCQIYIHVYIESQIVKGEWILVDFLLFLWLPVCLSVH